MKTVLKTVFYERLPDSLAWKTLDDHHPSFASFYLSFASDGFNPCVTQNIAQAL